MVSLLLNILQPSGEREEALGLQYRNRRADALGSHTRKRELEVLKHHGDGGNRTRRGGWHDRELIHDERQTEHGAQSLPR
jgi:hypothetical protein